MAEKNFAAGGVVLKLKTANFALRTRHARLPAPTALPDTLFAAARPLLLREADGTAFRLIGVGAQPLLPASLADQGDLADPEAPRRAARWRAMEALAGALRRGGGGAGARVAEPVGAELASPVGVQMRRRAPA